MERISRCPTSLHLQFWLIFIIGQEIIYFIIVYLYEEELYREIYVLVCWLLDLVK